MEWYLLLLLMFGILFALIAIGMPVGFAFLGVNILVGGLLIWGWDLGMNQIVLGAYNSVNLFSLVPLLMFILMGDVLFHSGLAPRMIGALDHWLGRVPGRLSFLAVGGGTLISTMSGASFASVAILGSTLVPDMERRGYSKMMSLGPILGSGGLAILIPPSSLAVLLAVVVEMSIGRVLLAIVVPGIMLAISYAIYILFYVMIRPSSAPKYDVVPATFSVKILDTVRYVLPAGFIIFMVLGLIFFGLATATESSATGALATLILAALYRKLTRSVSRTILQSTLEVSVMIFMLLVGSKAFSQILVFGGINRGLARTIEELGVAPILVILGMIAVLTVLGTFMSIGPIIAIMAPLLFPIAVGLGYDRVWFAVVFLLTMEIASGSPPFGLNLFVMKGVAPSDTTMGDIYWAGIPFIACDFVVLGVILAFPDVVLWLPRLAGL